MIYIALYDIHGYIECRLQKEKKVNNITLEVVRDTHYEYFRSMEFFWVLLVVFVFKKRMRWIFLFSAH